MLFDLSRKIRSRAAAAARFTTITSLLVCLGLLASGCGPAASAAPTSTPTSVPPTPALIPTDTPLPAATAPQEPQVITSANAAALTAYSFAVPEIPERLLWPSAPLEGQPAADLYLQSGAALHPILLDPPGLGQPIALPLNGARIFDVAPDASSIAVQDSNGLALYSLSGPLLHVLDEPQPYGAAYNLTSRLIAVTSASEWAVSLYDTGSGQKIQRLTGFETAAPIYSAAVSPDGRTVIWYVRATLQFQDVQSGVMGRDWRYEDFITTLAFDPTSRYLAVVVAGRLELYTLPGGDSAASVGLSGPVHSLAFSPDGSLMAAAYGDTIQLWNSADLTPLTVLSGHQSPVTLVGWAPDGRHLVSIDENMQMFFWTVPPQ